MSTGRRARIFYFQYSLQKMPRKTPKCVDIHQSATGYFRNSNSHSFTHPSYQASMRLVMGATVKGKDIDEVDMATFEVR